MAVNKAVTDTQWSNAFSPGRPAGDPNTIVIHYWGIDGQKHQNVVNYLCRAGGDTSAHYVVSAGRVTQLVHDYDRAWHAGSGGNPRGIGIECRPEMSAGDFETVAKLIAAIRDEWGDLPLTKHNDYMSTSCPGPWASQLGRLSARANEIRSGKKPATTTPAPAPTTGGSASAGGTTNSLTSTDRQLTLAVDGELGGSTIARWQQVMGTTIDGRLDDGSPCVKQFQRFLNRELGAKHTKNLTGKTALDVDGDLGWRTTKAWQFWSANRFPGHLKNIKGWTLTSSNFGQWVDGEWGANTTRMLQAALNQSYANSGKIGAK